MFGFDKIFDFNRDGKLDSFERTMQFQFLDEMSREESHDSGNSWDDGKTKRMSLQMLDSIMINWSLWIRKKEEKFWKTQDWIRMSLIFIFLIAEVG